MTTANEYLAGFTSGFTEFKAAHAAQVAELMRLTEGLKLDSYFGALHETMAGKLASALRPSRIPLTTEAGRQWFQANLATREDQLGAVLWLGALDGLLAEVSPLLDSQLYTRTIKDRMISQEDKQALVNSMLAEVSAEQRVSVSLAQVLWSLLTPGQRIKVALKAPVRKTLAALGDHEEPLKGLRKLAKRLSSAIPA